MANFIHDLGFTKNCCLTQTDIYKRCCHRRADTKEVCWGKQNAILLSRKACAGMHIGKFYCLFICDSILATPRSYDIKYSNVNIHKDSHQVQLHFTVRANFLCADVVNADIIITCYNL